MVRELTRKQTFKNVLWSIFIGACVAFVSSLIDGVADMLKGYANNAAGGIVSAVTYALRRS